MNLKLDLKYINFTAKRLNMNIGYLLNNSASKYPDRTAIISEEGRWTYRAFNERTNRLAGALLDRLTHHVHIVEIIADSFRLKSSVKKDKDKEQQ